METKLKTYLGDSVYADYDGYHIWIYTDNGLGATNKIALEPNVYDALIQFNEKVKRMIEKTRK